MATIKNYNDLNSLELDTLKEIGSIGSGNAATALSDLIGQEIRIRTPEVRIMGYNEAIEWIGGPEEITAGVLVKISGQINGIMLNVQQLDFVNLVLESMLGKHVKNYEELTELESSALIEVAQIQPSYANTVAMMAAKRPPLLATSLAIAPEKASTVLPLIKPTIRPTIATSVSGINLITVVPTWNLPAIFGASAFIAKMAQR